ncbi:MULTISPECIES: cytochrome c oxidase assembly factor CtaG [Jeotgalicoccus]|uniref:cytochrome c oxidase assembly factor CtaG n=1 Tax=Jeotgalicoccus TaxID=227979 RepID=UPI0004037BA8|nr:MULTISPECIES: cytochrome c oxidase assembly factor CtaG [Jeotgalicoccus]QQD85810.1 cytochrome c oxidase assembly factor CtaG [Jeotgalicoccus sp. ATCC 8456]
MENITSIKIFGFMANWSPFFMAFVIMLTVVYFLVTVRWYKDFEGGRPLTPKEGSLFVVNMILLYLMYGGPVDILSHILFTFHMIQMAFVLFLIAPLLYFSIPEYLQKYIVSLPVIGPVLRLGAKKPLFSLMLLIAAFSIYHLPVVMDNLKMSATLHTLVLAIMFLTAVMAFYPMFNKVEPEETHMGGLFKLLYIFGIGAFVTPACALIIFSSEPLYATFTEGEAWLSAMELCVPAGVLDSIAGSGMISGPEYFTNSTPLNDQQTGGIIMKVLQEIIFGVMLGFIFSKWYKDEHRDEDKITEQALIKAQQQKELYNSHRV